MQVSAYLKLSVAVALATIALKTAAWWVTGSVSLLSDALESLVNLAGATFALLMVTIAAHPADDDHPYGHHKAEYFSSGFEGVLILVAALAIIAAAVQRFWAPQPLDSLGWGLSLSLVSTAMNGALAWAMLRKAREHRSMALEGDARHLFTDVWTSVGVVLGLLAVGATGWLWLDPVVAIAVAANIAARGRVADPALGRRPDGQRARTAGAGRHRQDAGRLSPPRAALRPRELAPRRVAALRRPAHAPARRLEPGAGGGPAHARSSRR